jgi:hypothetical protein
MTSGTREEEGELTESSRGMVRHPKERESVQGVTGPASSREELYSQDPAISSSLSFTAVKRMNVSTEMTAATRLVRAWVPLAVSSGVVYAAYSMARMWSLARAPSARGWDEES